MSQIKLSVVAYITLPTYTASSRLYFVTDCSRSYRFSPTTIVRSVFHSHTLFTYPARYIILAVDSVFKSNTLIKCLKILGHCA